MDEEQKPAPQEPPKTPPEKTKEEYEKEIAKLTAERDKALKERDEANTKIREQTGAQKEVDPFDELFGRA